MASFKGPAKVMTDLILLQLLHFVSRQSVHLVLPAWLRLSTFRSALAIGFIAALSSAVPSARRAQVLIMPGTLPTHQTSDELLASTSDAMANDISDSSISSISSDKGLRHSGVTHSGSTMTDDVISGGNSGISSGSSGVSHSSSQSNPTNTVRMGKLLDEQPRIRSNTHHHVSATGR